MTKRNQLRKVLVAGKATYVFTGDEKLFAEWEAIKTPEEALLAVARADGFLGGDRYYNDIVEKLMGMVERVCKGIDESRNVSDDARYKALVDEVGWALLRNDPVYDSIPDWSSLGTKAKERFRSDARKAIEATRRSPNKGDLLK